MIEISLKSYTVEVPTSHTKPLQIQAFFIFQISLKNSLVDLMNITIVLHLYARFVSNLTIKNVTIEKSTGSNLIKRKGK